MDICFDFQLDKKSVVLDIGGYNGDFAWWVRGEYGCGVHIFEPCLEFFKGIVKRTDYDPMFWPHFAALSDRDCTGTLYVRGDSTTALLSKEGTPQTTKFWDVYKFIQAFKLTRIDLLKLNCEGGEYPILRRLHECGFLPNVRHIVVQFHSLEGEDVERYRRICGEGRTVGHQCNHWTWWRPQ